MTGPQLKEIITEHWYAIGATIGMVLVWFKDNITKLLSFNKNQQLKQENIDNVHLNNLEETFELYKKIIDDLVNRYEAKVVELKEEISDLKKRIKELEKFIENREV